MSRLRDRRRSDHTLSHAFIRAVWMGFAAMVALLALGFGVERMTASPVLCNTCHEVRPFVDAWKTSPHTQIACASCHEEPRAWYRFPETLAVRGAMLARDIDAHLALPAEGTPGASIDTSVTIPDENCLRCHETNREVTSRPGTLIDHEEHAERNESCVSCHRWTAHPEAGAERALLFMEQCFTCHSHEEEAEASGACEVCHPSDFELVPETHGADTWQIDHGRSAAIDLRQCAICHEQTVCADCHGVQMPHPSQWADGAVTHPVAVRAGRDLCDRCHGETPDFCTVCHHEGFMPKRGPWLDQHPNNVSRRGVATCMDCHAPTFCVDCHTDVRGEPGSAFPDS